MDGDPTAAWYRARGRALRCKLQVVYVPSTDCLETAVCETERTETPRENGGKTTGDAESLEAAWRHDPRTQESPPMAIAAMAAVADLQVSQLVRG
jgi:hypothetical protein